MAEEGITGISVGEFETIPQLLASSESLQLAFVFLIIGLVVIGIVYRKFSHWVSSQKLTIHDHIFSICSQGSTTIFCNSFSIDH